MIRKLLNIKLLFSILLAPMVTLFMLFLVENSLKSRIGYKDVLLINIPVDVNCENEKFMHNGFDRPYYSYILVLAGSPNNLMDIINMLGLQEVDFKTYKGVNYMDDYLLDWWVPPSVSKTENFKFYQKSIYWSKGRSHLRSRIQVELTPNKLYLASIGDMTTLRMRLRERSWIFCLL